MYAALSPASVSTSSTSASATTATSSSTSTSSSSTATATTTATATAPDDATITVGGIPTHQLMLAAIALSALLLLLLCALALRWCRARPTGPKSPAQSNNRTSAFAQRVANQKGAFVAGNASASHNHGGSSTYLASEIEAQAEAHKLAATKLQAARRGSVVRGVSRSDKRPAQAPAAPPAAQGASRGAARPEESFAKKGNPAPARSDESFSNAKQAAAAKLQACRRGSVVRAQSKQLAPALAGNSSSSSGCGACGACGSSGARGGTPRATPKGTPKGTPRAAGAHGKRAAAPDATGRGGGASDGSFSNAKQAAAAKLQACRRGSVVRAQSKQLLGLSDGSAPGHGADTTA
jgi:hypothetical protein